jgi:hypothetical protein
LSRHEIGGGELDMMTADRPDYWHGTPEIVPANIKLLAAP